MQMEGRARNLPLSAPPQEWVPPVGSVTARSTKNPGRSATGSEGLASSEALGKKTLGMELDGGVWRTASKPPEGTPRRGRVPSRKCRWSVPLAGRLRGRLADSQ